jgi:hypothetical protein
MKNLLKSLAAVGEAAENNIVKSTFGDVSVYFALPLEVVKIETNPPQSAYAKLCRLCQNALNGAYAAVQKAAADGKMPQDGVTTVSTDGNLGVVIKSNGEIQEMGFKKAPSEEGNIEGFLKNLVIAANAGYLQAQINATELGKSFLQG